MSKLVALLMLLSPILLTTEGFSEQKVARIECPAEAKAKVTLSDKIGEDPTFSRELPDQWIVFAFKKMDRAGQKLTCQYEYKNGTALLIKSYEYTAKRTIRSCTKVSARVLDCQLQ